MELISTHVRATEVADKARIAALEKKQSPSEKRTKSRIIRSKNPSWHGKKQLKNLNKAPEPEDDEERTARAGWPAAPASAAICRPRLTSSCHLC
jgi:hypothetical protein